MTKSIDQFKGDYRFLSNFFPSSIEMYDGVRYPTSEHAFQAHKTHSMEERRHIASLDTPGKAKRAGRRVTLRDDWEVIKISIMEGVLFQKFSMHLDLRQKLIDTGDAELIEGNTWGDTFWGVCRGKGENHLGKLLMKIRQALKQARRKT